MESTLQERFRAYIARHHPERAIIDQNEYPLSRFIRERVKHVLPTLKFLQDQGKSEAYILDACMEEMARDLRPSRADYIRDVMERDFPREYQKLAEAGSLTYHVVMIMERARETFDNFGYTESNSENPLMRHAIIYVVHGYVNSLTL